MFRFTDSARVLAAAAMIAVPAGAALPTASASPGPSPAPGATATAANLSTLMSLLSEGYDSTNCTPVSLTGPDLAEVSCGQNSIDGGPTRA